MYVYNSRICLKPDAPRSTMAAVMTEVGNQQVPTYLVPVAGFPSKKSFQKKASNRLFEARLLSKKAAALHSPGRQRILHLPASQCQVLRYISDPIELRDEGLQRMR